MDDEKIKEKILYDVNLHPHLEIHTCLDEWMDESIFTSEPEHTIGRWDNDKKKTTQASNCKVCPKSKEDKEYSRCTYDDKLVIKNEDEKKEVFLAYH